MKDKDYPDYIDEINKIYEFLDIPLFEHRFNNLKQLKNNGISYNDKLLGDGLHTIMTKKVEKREYDMREYLPKDLSKYDVKPFWRN